MEKNEIDQVKRKKKVSKKGSGFRKSAIHHILHLYCTQFIKHFHIMTLHIKPLTHLVALLGTAQQTVLQQFLLIKDYCENYALQQRVRY